MSSEGYAIHTAHGEEERSAGGVAVRQGPGGWEALCLERPRYGDWSLPKGHLEPGETAEAAALRELTEETGTRGRIARFLTTIRYPITGRSGRPTTKVVDHFLIMVLAGNPPAAPQPPELDIPHWLPLSEAAGAMTHPGDAASIRRAAEVLRAG
jgi:8-oxo-(d)GTP phosphatase